MVMDFACFGDFVVCLFVSTWWFCFGDFTRFVSVVSFHSCGVLVHAIGFFRGFLQFTKEGRALLILFVGAKP